MTRQAIPVARRYKRFSVWSNGAISPPNASTWDDGTLAECHHACRSAERLIRMHPAPGPCGPECDAGGAACYGWEIFDSGIRGPEIEAVNACHKFDDDDKALAAALVFFDQYAAKRQL